MLYPNPGKEGITIIFENDRKNSTFVSIANSSGLIVKSLETNEDNLKVNTDNLTQGAYYITIYIPENGFFKKDQFVVIK